MVLKKTRGSNKSRETCKLTMDNDFTIYSIDSIKEELTKEIDSYKVFELNLENVEEIDSAGVQLLLAFDGELAQKDKVLKITAVSSSVAEIMEIYGLRSRLNMDGVV
jgi:anti-anti-sigma factor